MLIKQFKIDCNICFNRWLSDNFKFELDFDREENSYEILGGVKIIYHVKKTPYY